MRTKTTKKVSTDQSQHTASDDLRAEYYFDYHQARPNRFAGEESPEIEGQEHLNGVVARYLHVEKTLIND